MATMKEKRDASGLLQDLALSDLVPTTKGPDGANVAGVTTYQDIIDSFQLIRQAALTAAIDAIAATIDGLTVEDIAGTEAYTLAEKNKLAALDDEHFKGVYATEAALVAAHPTANAGDYAHVDGGVGANLVQWSWDESDAAWIEGGGAAAETPASVRTKLLMNADTNILTDLLLNKLNEIQAGAQVNPALISQADAEAGTDETPRLWNALRVKQAIVALASAAAFDIDGLDEGDLEEGDALSGYSEALAQIVKFLVGPDILETSYANQFTADQVPMDDPEFTAPVRNIPNAIGELQEGEMSIPEWIKFWSMALNPPSREVLAAADYPVVEADRNRALKSMATVAGRKIILPNALNLEVEAGFRFYTDWHETEAPTIEAEVGATLNGLANGSCLMTNRYGRAFLESNGAGGWRASGAVGTFTEGDTSGVGPLLILHTTGGTNGLQDKPQQSTYTIEETWGTIPVVDTANPVRGASSVALVAGGVEGYIHYGHIDEFDLGTDDFTGVLDWEYLTREWGDVLFGAWLEEALKRSLRFGLDYGSNKLRADVSFNGSAGGANAASVLSASDVPGSGVRQLAVERHGPNLNIYMEDAEGVGVLEGTVNIGSNPIFYPGDGYRFGHQGGAAHATTSPRGRRGRFAFVKRSLFKSTDYSVAGFNFAEAATYSNPAAE